MNNKSKDASWQGYSAHVADDQALAAFVAKFSRRPDEIRRTGGGVNVGPLRPKERKE